MTASRPITARHSQPNQSSNILACQRYRQVITYKPINKLPDPKNIDYIPNIMQSLQRFVDCANSYEKDASISTTSSFNEPMNRIEEMFKVQVDIPLNSHSSSDKSEVASGMYEEVMECFHGANNVSHHVNQSLIMMTSAPVYSGFPLTTYSYYNPYDHYLPIDETND
ncbi:10478_t:CDS:2, partial [Funneliformis mosseae]